MCYLEDNSTEDYGADALVELPVDVSKPDEVSDVGGPDLGFTSEAPRDASLPFA